MKQINEVRKSEWKLAKNGMCSNRNKRNIDYIHETNGTDLTDSNKSNLTRVSVRSVCSPCQTTWHTVSYMQSCRLHARQPNPMPDK